MVSCTRLFVESLDACTAWEHLLLEDDRTVAAGLSDGRRRREFLAWRSVVRRELGGIGISYAPTGAPRLADGGSLSVSHCDQYVAVCISDGPCGVDVERIDRNFDRLLSRYASASERALCGDPHLPAALWCAKEALYKYAGREGLDLRRDLRITAVDFVGGSMEGTVCDGDPVAIRLRTFDAHLLAWIG